jgi:hypothetical protein
MNEPSTLAKVAIGIGMVVFLFLLPSVISWVGAEECKPSNIDAKTRWAYDKEAHTLRLCQELGASELTEPLYRCTEFPKKVYVGEDAWGDNPFE